MNHAVPLVVHRPCSQKKLANASNLISRIAKHSPLGSRAFSSSLLRGVTSSSEARLSTICTTSSSCTSQVSLVEAWKAGQNMAWSSAHQKLLMVCSFMFSWVPWRAWICCIQRMHLQVLSVNISLHDSIGVHTLRWPPHPINRKSQKLLHEGKKKQRQRASESEAPITIVCSIHCVVSAGSIIGISVTVGTGSVNSSETMRSSWISIPLWGAGIGSEGSKLGSTAVADSITSAAGMAITSSTTMVSTGVASSTSCGGPQG